MFNNLFLWPDQFPSVAHDDDLWEVARLYRLQKLAESEAHLLSLDVDSLVESEYTFLLALMRLSQRRYRAFEIIYVDMYNLQSQHPFARFLYAQYLLQKGDISKLKAQGSSFWATKDIFWPLLLAQSALAIHLNSCDEALQFLNQIPLPWRHCLEAVRLRCRIYERSQEFHAALSFLLDAVKRFPQHLPTRIHLLDVAIKARSQEYTLPILNQLLDQHGECVEVLTLLSQIRMLQHRNADARKHILQNRVWNSITPNQESISSNIYNCYDRLGLVDWLSFASFSRDQSKYLELPLVMRENLCMQMASIEMSSYQRLLPEIVCEYKRMTQNASVVDGEIRHHQKISEKANLKIAWITGDLAYHPVGRFLLGFFNQLKVSRCQHFLLDIFDHANESRREWFESLPQLQVMNFGNGSLEVKYKQICSINADIAIDLSGWTSGHFMLGFMQRLAPIQLSYLGYFASTGLREMDYWLGDQNLFPEPMNEWHTEEIWRLNRCFLAWDPPEILPESSVGIDEASSDGGIRFGSFNHNRKLSNQTLKLWGEILSSIPDSRLVLKAARSDDSGTMQLLARRMSRVGLDPQQVIWLPRTSGEIEHLHQYSFIDVALDCFPNGGCTTTCEALWMGVPVITLSGRSYVSRMSTAVLHGAGMSDWCVSSFAKYMELAKIQSGQISWLRQNRSHWRSQLKTNPLGDAADLIHHLEEAFAEMALASR